MKKIVFTFGRMNPPTSGHQKLVDKVNAVAKTERADARVYLSHTQNKKKDPLDYIDKIRYAQRAFGSVVHKSPSKTIIQIAQELEKAGYTDVVLVVGSDRVSEFETLLKKYNGKEYNFDSIRVQSAGQRDPDAEGVAGMSASKLRELAKEGDFAGFKQGLPKGLQSMAKAIYDKLRGIMEETDLTEGKVLTVQQRLKRARVMRRLSRRMARQRKIRKTRLADQPRLERRARKKAIQFLRKRIAGDKGLHYAELGTAQKVSIDKLVAKKSGMIAKIAKRLLPKVRKAEMERLKQARTPKNEQEEPTMEVKTFKSLFESRPGPHEVSAKQKIARERRQDAMKHDTALDQARIRDANLKNRGIRTEEQELDELSPVTLIKYASKAAASAQQARKVGDVATAAKREKGIATAMDKEVRSRTAPKPPMAEQALARKADESGWSLSIIEQVYLQGIIDFDSTKQSTCEQQAFQAVNSFIADNRDLTEMLRKEGSKYTLYSKDGSKKLGEFDSKEAALKREKQIQFFKHQNEGVELDEIGAGTVARYLGKRFRQANKVGGESLPTKKSPETYLKNVDRASNRLMKDAQEAAGSLKDACWKGYEAIGTKKKDGKEVPNCVPVKEDAQKKNLKSILSKKKEAKSTAGAGEWGTDELVKNYVKDTPYMSIEEAVDAKKLLLLARLGLVDDVTMFRRVMKKMEDEKTLTPQEREVIYGAFAKFADLVTNDPQTFQKARKAVKEAVGDGVQAVDQLKLGKGTLMKNPQGEPKKPFTGGIYNSPSATRTTTTFNKGTVSQSTRIKGVTEESELDEAPLVLRGRADANQTMLKMVQTYISNASDSDLQKLAKMIGKKITIQGKKVVIEGFAEEDLAELSTDLLTRYKKKAADDASAADKKGDYAKGNKRFSGIMRATKKQFDNETKEDLEVFCPETGELVESLIIEESEHEGKKVKLNNPFRLPAGSKKKFGVYVKNDKGNTVKVTFGDPNMEIKRDDPDRRAAYRSRHGCDNPGPKWKANYWSCYQWRASKKVDN